MLEIGLNIKSTIFAFLRNIIFTGMALFVYSTILQSAEITIGLTSYKYRELDSSENFFMEDKSAPFLFSVGLRDWGDTTVTPNTDSNIWSFLYSLEYSFGNIDYISANTGTMKTEYYKSRFEYYLSKNSSRGANDLKTYIGLGYRNLLDDSGFKKTSTNHLGYDRLSQYFYVPIGAIWYISENISLKSQYNYFLEGKQISYMNDILPNDYPTNPEKTQRIGYGIDLTVRSKLNRKWSTYGFFRYWNIEDSDVVSCSALTYCYEPNNQTHEIGAGISYHF